MCACITHTQLHTQLHARTPPSYHHLCVSMSSLPVDSANHRSTILSSKPLWSSFPELSRVTPIYIAFVILIVKSHPGGPEIHGRMCVGYMPVPHCFTQRLELLVAVRGLKTCSLWTGRTTVLLQYGNHIPARLHLVNKLVLHKTAALRDYTHTAS